MIKSEYNTTNTERFTLTTPTLSHRQSCDELTASPPSQNCALADARSILDSARAISACDTIWPSSRAALAEALLDELARILARMTLDMHRGDFQSPGA